MKRRIMTSSLFFIFAAATTISILAVSFGATARGEDEARTNAFARRAAGSYLMDVDFQGLRLMALVTFGADGNFSFEDTTDYGAFSPPSPAFESDQRGAWKRSGRKQVSFLSIGFSYDDSGGLSGWSRHRATVEFDRNFESFRLVNAWVDIFADPAADPLHDDPLLSLPFTATARRIPAVLE